MVGSNASGIYLQTPWLLPTGRCLQKLASEEAPGYGRTFANISVSLSSPVR